MIWKIYGLIANCIIFLLCSVLKVYAISINDTVTIEADHVSYIHTNNQIIANGNVRITNDSQIITANQAIYNPKTQDIDLIGDITFLYGSKLYHAKLTKLNLNNRVGLLEGFNANLNNRCAILRANKAWIVNEDQVELSEANFSACPIRPDNFIANTPIWNIKAKRAVFYKSEEKIHYEEAVIEIFGKPILYIPQFSSPAPDAKRRTGLLYPSIKWTDNLGLTLKTPIYFNIKDNLDFTFEPMITSRAGIVYHGEVRHILENGKYHINLSALGYTPSVKKQKFLGHIFMNADFRSDAGYFGINIKRARDRDKTYLKKYNISEQDFLISRLYNYYTYNSHKILTEGVFFQGLRERDNAKVTPIAFPKIHYRYLYDLGFGKFYTNWYLNNIVRPQGARYFKIDIDNKFNRSLWLNNGQFLSLTLKQNIESYNFTYKPIIIPSPDPSLIIGNNGNFSKDNKLIDHEIEIFWKWPFIKNIKHSNDLTLLQPKIDIAYGRKRPDDIFLNQDSIYSDITTYNLWDSNTRLGNDYYNYGLRAGYGMEYIINKSKYIESLSLTLGRRFQDRKMEHSHYSDYLSRIALKVSNNVQFSQRVSFNLRDWRVNHHEFNMEFDRNRWKIDINYVMLRGIKVDRELESKAHFVFNTEWRLSLKMRTKFSALPNNSNGMVYDGLGVHYHGECLNFNAEIGRDYRKMKDLRPSNTFAINFNIPNGLL